MKKKYPIRAIKDIGKNTTDGVCVYDLEEDAFVYFNDGFLNLLQASGEQLSVNAREVITQRLGEDEPYAIQQFMELRTHGRIKDVEFRVKIDAADKFVSVDAFLLHHRTLVVAMVKDITLAKQHSNYIVEFGARKDALLDMIAHNLSGPLNLTNDLLNALDQSTRSQQYKKVDHLSHLIREATQQCIEIINSFLNEEHSESERVSAKNNLFEVNSRVKIVVERLKQFNKDKQFNIIANKNEIMVSADDVKFFQVVHNLLSNAVKFTPTHGVITITINDYQHFFEVSIADNGIGIPTHLHPYIFQRNTPASRVGLRGEQSIGMGLYIVKKLVDMMHGSISFQSEEHAGCNFLIRLPKE